MNDFLDRPISFFRSVRDKHPARQITAREFLTAIHDGTWRLGVEAVREAFARRGKKGADELKNKLPAVTPSGTFTTRRNGALNSHSGLLCLDLDGLGGELETVRRKLTEDQHPLAVFTSPSGQGLKVLVATDATDAATHLRGFQAAQVYFRALGLTLDPSGKDLARLCYVSFDPGVWVRPTGGVSLSLLSVRSAPICTPAYSALSALSARHGEVLSRRQARAASDRDLEKTPRLARIFRAYVENRPAHPSRRNETLTKIVPALFSVVAEPVVVRLSLLWFDLNRRLFKASPESHEAETVALIEGCAQSYVNALPADCRAVYEILSDRERAAFRICRDLAQRSKTPPSFFLSCDELAERIGCDSRQAHRILVCFRADGLLDCLTVGTIRAP